LQAEGTRNQPFVDAFSGDEPLPEPSRAMLPLAGKRSAQLFGADPALLEHEQAQRDAMAVSFDYGAASVEFARDGGVE
jgi:hypothetical protein